jgi:hypothetical protein
MRQIKGTKIIRLLKGVKRPKDDEWQREPIDPESQDGTIILDRVAKGYTNYGIHTGASGLLIIDIDPRNGGDPEKFFSHWPKTYTVRTPSGGFHLYYRWQDSSSMTGKRTPEPGVDYLAGMSYAVGPGSVVGGIAYTVHDDTDFAEAPSYAIANYMTANDGAAPGANILTVSSDLATAEGRNSSLTKTMGILRQNGLSDAMVKPVALTLNQQFDVPLEESEVLNTVVKSALKWKAGEEDILVKTIGMDEDEFIGDSSTLPFVGEKPIRWVIDDFIPESELCILWGGPKVGKSTFCAWVAARASLQGKHVLFVGAGEERKEVFAAKFRESGGDMAFFHYWKTEAVALKFPKHAEFFANHIKDKGYGLVYFDSLRAVMDADNKKNEADRSRDALQPIAQIAQDVGVTILLTTHPMKSKQGDVEIMLGSGELKAVARAVLHVKAGSTENTFFVTVDATNTRKPDEDLLVIRGERPFCDHRTGAVQTEIRENGEERKMTIPYIESVERIKKGTGEEAEQSPSTSEEYGERYEAFKKAWIDGEVRELSEAEELFGMSRATFFRYKKRVQSEETKDLNIGTIAS